MRGVGFLASCGLWITVGACGGDVVVTTCSVSINPPISISSSGYSFVAQGMTVLGVTATNSAMVQLSSSDDPCRDQTQGSPAQRNVLDVVLGYDQPLYIGDVNRPGTFTVGQGTTTAYLRELPSGVTDFSGTNPTDVNAISGTIDVPCNVPGVRLSGHFDLMFPDGAHVAGDFDAPYCTKQLSNCTGAHYATCAESHPP